MEKNQEFYEKQFFEKSFKSPYIFLNRNKQFPKVI